MPHMNQEHMNQERFWIYSGYQFVGQDDPARARFEARQWLEHAGLRGTVLLAREGLNFSLAGAREPLDQWLAWAATALGADAPVLNRQPVDAPPFQRLRVRLRPEIVTFDPAIDPGHLPGATEVSPADWNRLLDRTDVQLVDTRNDYEFRLGSFVGALNPETARFVDFKQFCETELDPDRPVAMFCTGGVRCAKAGAWMKAQGFGHVFQLKGGILGYLDQVADPDSRWRGECFVFDDRVSVDGRLRPTDRVVCRGCRQPGEGLDPAGNPPIGPDGACERCGQRFDPAQAERMRERARQVRLAAARGRPHLGPAAQSGGGAG